MKTDVLLAVLVICLITGTQGCGGPFCVYSQGRCVCNYRRMLSAMHMVAKSDGKQQSKRQYDDRPATQSIKCPYSHLRSMLSTVFKRQYDLYYGCT